MRGNTFWEDLPIIDAYTREDAIDDGVLVDVSGLAGEAGYPVPVAVTNAVHTDLTDPIPEEFAGGAGPNERLREILRAGKPSFDRAAGNPGERIPITLITRFGTARRRPYNAVVVVADEGKGPAATIMRLDED